MFISDFLFAFRVLAWLLLDKTARRAFENENNCNGVNAYENY